MQPANNVMVLYTGGTIGMQASANGLAPASGFEARMSEALAQLNMPAWRFREMSPLIDSANMTPAYWQRLRAAVVEAVDEGCDAVLVLHGTDTLAYSAAAMSFQLLGLPAPVLFTGSMLPAGVPDSDAWENVSGALAALGEGLAPGVQLYFHGALMAPTRCAKIRSFGRHPFAALQRNGGVAKADMIPAALHYRQPKALINVGVLPLVPGIAAAQLDGLIDSGIQALLLEQGDRRRRRLGPLDLGVAQFAAEEQVVGRATTDRDAQAIAVQVGHLLRRAVLAHQVGAFDLHIGGTEGDAVGTRRIDGQEGQVPGILAGRSDHRGR